MGIISIVLAVKAKLWDMQTCMAQLIIMPGRRTQFHDYQTYHSNVVTAPL